MSKTYIDERGYARFRDSGKLVHRYVAEKMLGRRLKPQEVVHHKDRNKLNNSPDNLQVCKNQAEHDWIHRRDAWLYGKTASYQGFHRTRRDQGGCMLYILLLACISSLAFLYL